jgi:hypothetical protein
VGIGSNQQQGLIALLFSIFRWQEIKNKLKYFSKTLDKYPVGEYNISVSKKDKLLRRQEMDTRIGELKCEDGVVRNVIAAAYRDGNGKQRYQVQIEGTNEDVELSGFKSISECSHAAYVAWPDTFVLDGSPERLGNYSDEDADEGIVQIIAVRFYNRWEIFLSPQKGQLIPAHLGNYPSLLACRRAVYSAYGARITLS